MWVSGGIMASSHTDPDRHAQSGHTLSLRNRPFQWACLSQPATYPTVSNMTVAVHSREFTP